MTAPPSISPPECPHVDHGLHRGAAPGRPRRLIRVPNCRRTRAKCRGARREARYRPRDDNQSAEASPEGRARQARPWLAGSGGGTATAVRPSRGSRDCLVRASRRRRNAGSFRGTDRRRRRDRSRHVAIGPAGPRDRTPVQPPLAVNCGCAARDRGGMEVPARFDRNEEIVRRPENENPRGADVDRRHARALASEAAHQARLGGTSGYPLRLSMGEAGGSGSGGSGSASSRSCSCNWSCRCRSKSSVSSSSSPVTARPVRA